MQHSKWKNAVHVVVKGRTHVPNIKNIIRKQKNARVALLMLDKMDFKKRGFYTEISEIKMDILQW